MLLCHLSNLIIDARLFRVDRLTRILVFDHENNVSLWNSNYWLQCWYSAWKYLAVN